MQNMQHHTLFREGRGPKVLGAQHLAAAMRTSRRSHALLPTVLATISTSTEEWRLEFFFDIRPTVDMLHTILSPKEPRPRWARLPNKAH